MELPGTLFGPSSKIKKKSTPNKITGHFWKWISLILILTSYISGNENPKKISYISQKKAVLIFQEMETPKKFLIFS